MTREDILKRIAIEDARINSADRNIEGLIIQRGKSQDEISRLQILLESFPDGEPEAGV
jgi:hypothetical protein